MKWRDADTPHPEAVLLRITCKVTSKTFEICAWPSYGVVCPPLWTTNGSIPYVARQLADAFQAGSYHPTDDPTWLVPEAQIAARLRELYGLAQKGPTP